MNIEKLVLRLSVAVILGKFWKNVEETLKREMTSNLLLEKHTGNSNVVNNRKKFKEILDNF